MPLDPHTRLGSYEIEALLGAGAMGEVYLATDTALRRQVAIKLLSTVEADTRARLLHEARAASALNHPHICTVHEVRTDTAVPYLVMEYVGGRPLSQIIPPEGLPVPSVLRYGAEIADGLAHAHARGVLHRDLKSANVAITPDGRAKILDFGIALQVAAGAPGDATTVGPEGAAFAGTLAYMAPEILQGRAASAAADVWSLGVLLHEMATGRLPFGGDTTFELVAAIQHAPLAPLPPHVPTGLAAIIRRCLEKDPVHRYHHAGEVRAALEAVQSHGEAPHAPATDRPRAFPKGAVIALALAAVAVAAAAWRLLSGSGSRDAVRSIAVLPLQNRSADPSDDEFVEGMTDELTSVVAKIEGLHVKSRSVTMKYRNSPLSLGEIAASLGVDAVIHGSVARSGDRIRIRAGMVEARTDRQLWAETYDERMTDVLALQAGFARAIAEGLRVKLTATDQARLAARGSVDSEAYELYVRAMTRFARNNNQDNLSAIELFRQALARDPDFAEAHGGLALAYALRAFSYAPHERSQFEPLARAAIERTLALDPRNAHARLADARLTWSRERGWPHADALRRMREVVALSRTSEDAIRNLAILYNHLGFPEQALAEFNKIEIIHPAALLQKGMALQTLGRNDEALASYESIPSGVRSPFAMAQMALTLVALGRAAEAQTAVDTYMATRSVDDYSGLLAAVRSLLFAIAGRTADAEAQIETSAARKESGEFHHSSYMIGLTYLRLGQPQKAMDWLEHAANDGFPCYPLFVNDRSLDPLRRDARFVAFLEKLRKEWEGYRQVVIAP